MSNNKKTLIVAFGIIAVSALIWVFAYKLDIFGYYTIIGEPTVGTAKVN